MKIIAKTVISWIKSCKTIEQVETIEGFVLRMNFADAPMLLNFCSIRKGEQENLFTEIQNSIGKIEPEESLDSLYKREIKTASHTKVTFPNGTSFFMKPNSKVEKLRSND